MTPLARLSTTVLLAAAMTAPAYADVAPGPVEIGGIAAIGLGLVALVIFAGIFILRRLRARKPVQRQ